MSRRPDRDQTTQTGEVDPPLIRQNENEKKISSVRSMFVVKLLKMSKESCDYFWVSGFKPSYLDESLTFFVTVFVCSEVLDFCQIIYQFTSAVKCIVSQWTWVIALYHAVVWCTELNTVHWAQCRVWRLCTWTWGWAEEKPNGTGVWKLFSCYCWCSDRHWFKPVQSTVSEGEFKLILKWKWGTRGNFFKLKSAHQSHLNCCYIYSWMWRFTETKVQKMWCTNTYEANCVTTWTGRSTVLYQSE